MEIDGLTIEPEENKFTICEECETHHYTNCPKCFGFGLAQNPGRDPYPMGAADAYGIQHGNVPHNLVFPCPVCGSTVEGMPK